MSKLYGVLSQTCGSLAVALLAVALTAAANRHAFADAVPVPIEECECLDSENPEECEALCASVCDVTCTGSYPQCGTGSCAAAKPGCSKYKCKLILSVKACECNPWDD